MAYPPEQLAYEMIRIRLSQLLVNEECKAGKIRVPIHLALGHEAIAVAVNHIARKEDVLVLPHRNIAYNLARLGKLRPILDEYLLKETGLAGGKLGSMNLNNPNGGILYTSSILGNNFPVSAGIAMTKKTSSHNNIVFVLGGDGSMEEGNFYESLVLMEALGLNVAVVIENNEWSLGTHITERRRQINLKGMANSLGIPYTLLNGNHAHRYIEVLENMRDEILRDGAPVCIEVMVKTLGDRKGEDGHFINYHAGAASHIDISEYAEGVLRKNEDDPLFVIRGEVGEKAFADLSHEVMEELRKELA